MTDLPDHLQPPTPRGAPTAEHHRDVVDAAVADRLFAAIAAETVDRAPTLRERLAQRPTGQRQALAVVVVMGLAAMWLGMMGHRDDLTGEAAWRFGGLAAVLLGTAAVAGRLALRPMDRRLPTGQVVAALLLVPTALAALPGVWPGMHTEHGASLDMHLMCGGMGTMFGMLAALAPLLLTRGRPEAPRIALIGASAGATAFVVQNLLCPLADTSHLVFAHGVASLMLAGLGVLGLTVWTRRAA